MQYITRFGTIQFFYCLWFVGVEPGSHLKRFTPGSVFSRIGISSSLAGPRLTKLVQEACAKAANENPTGAETVEPTDVEVVRGSPVSNSIGALMAGAAAKRRERQLLFSDVGPCRRALCARKDLAMRKRLRRLTGKVRHNLKRGSRPFFINSRAGMNNSPMSENRRLEHFCLVIFICFLFLMLTFFRENYAGFIYFGFKIILF